MLRVWSEMIGVEVGDLAGTQLAPPTLFQPFIIISAPEIAIRVCPFLV